MHSCSTRTFEKVELNSSLVINGEKDPGVGINES